MQTYCYKIYNFLSRFRSDITQENSVATVSVISERKVCCILLIQELTLFSHWVTIIGNPIFHQSMTDINRITVSVTTVSENIHVRKNVMFNNTLPL